MIKMVNQENVSKVAALVILPSVSKTNIKQSTTVSLKQVSSEELVGRSIGLLTGLPYNVKQL